MGRRNRTLLTNEQFFFVTTTIVGFKYVFTKDERCEILINNIKHYQRVHEFLVLAFVIMPSHFHWIVKVNPGKGTISDIMRDIKKYSAWDLLESLEKEKSNLLESFILDKPGKQKRQLWMHRFDDEVIRNNKMFCPKDSFGGLN
ncbi:MAG: transposase [Ignavibacteria bacterium]|jgi:REP element-mobilizing transposase RayT